MQLKTTSVLNNRQKWLRISTLILQVQKQLPHINYIQQIATSFSSYIDYFDTAEISFDLQQSQKLALVQRIYICQCMLDLKSRASILLSLQTGDVQTLVLGFCRLYDVALHFHSMFVNNKFQELIVGTVDLSLLTSNVTILRDTLQSLLDADRQETSKTFQQFMDIHFGKFIQLLDLRKQDKTVENKTESSPTKPTRKLSFESAVLGKVPLRPRKETRTLCQKFMERQDLYQTCSEQKIIRADAIEFCLMYRIRDMIEGNQDIYLKEPLINILKTLGSPSPNFKKYRALDPKSWNQYMERSKIFYLVIIDIINEASRGPKLTRRESFKQAYVGYYLAYHEVRGFSIKYGQITIVHKDDQYFLLIANIPNADVPKGDINIMIPGFVNLHTHTKFSFQGNVNFGSMFKGRFQWRQAQYEGKHVVEVGKLLGQGEAVQNEFKKYVKMYTQLQALIGGTTTIFQESKYDSDQIYPNIIRTTVLPPNADKQSFNISSNDIYVLWRNEKQKNDLMLSWSKDYTNFVRSVIQIELEVLESFESKRTNLHVHLAEGKSKFAITICEFDNFCQDIICMEHFLKHLKWVLRDKSFDFEKKLIISCESKTEELSGLNVISARSEDNNFTSFATIRKHIKFVSENQITTTLSLKIEYYYRSQAGHKQKVELEQISQSELVQVYQIHTLRSNLLVVHANGMDPTNRLHQYILKTYNVSICISPYSNISLYGGVNDFNWKDLLINPGHSNNMCISTDWSPTGKENLIEEIRFMLKKLKQAYCDIGPSLYQTLMKMITVNPARIIKMPVGEIKDNFFPDFWIGKFPQHKLVVDKGELSADKLIEYILTDFPYQNDILKVYSKGRQVYSNTPLDTLQEINLKHEKKRYFYNPEGSTDLSFQEYVATIRKLMTEKNDVSISLLFP